jgi:hypothetical protein
MHISRQKSITSRSIKNTGALKVKKAEGTALPLFMDVPNV